MRAFAKKIVVITGGASGIGKALCELLGEKKATVIVTDINLQGAQETAKLIGEHGGTAVAEHLDVSDAAKFDQLLQQTKQRYGKLDYLFNNAGFAVAGELDEIHLQDWEKIVQVNLMGTIYGTSSAYGIMKKQKSGCIVNMASVTGLIPSPMLTPYSTTKHAVVGLTTSLREEAKAFGVQVNAVCLGFIQTGIYDAATIVNARKQDVVAGIPFSLPTAEAAAHAIIRGIQTNQRIISFPWYATALWKLNALHPVLIAPLTFQMIRNFRRNRT